MAFRYGGRLFSERFHKTKQGYISADQAFVPLWLCSFWKLLGYLEGYLSTGLSEEKTRQIQDVKALGDVLKCKGDALLPQRCLGKERTTPIFIADCMGGGVLTLSAAKILSSILLRYQTTVWNLVTFLLFKNEFNLFFQKHQEICIAIWSLKNYNRPYLDLIIHKNILIGRIWL